MTVDAGAFKAVMSQWPSGVTVVTTVDGEGPAGMTASSFSSVSLSPPLVSICIARHLHMHTRLERAGVFAVNILSKDNVDAGRRFAGMLPGVTDRFKGIEVSTAVTGSPLLAETLGWVDCRIWAKHDGGDHTIFVGEVLGAGINETAAPLLYHSRSWGQFADVLAKDATILRAGNEASAMVLGNIFGDSADSPHNLDAIVGRVRDAMAGQGDSAMLVLDDAASAADPLLLRMTVQAIAGLVGKVSVVLRPGRGSMALANVLVALKSGIRHISTSGERDGPYVAEHDVRAMLGRMGVAVRS